MLLTFQAAVMLIFAQTAVGLVCSRYPLNTFSPKSPVDENFMILISGNPQTYSLGQKYNISLNAFNGFRFVSFGLTLENENGDSGYGIDLGHFEIVDDIGTRYSPKCINMVENTNTNSKTHVSVEWVAPSEPGSGCILIRAMVLQHRDVWYMDDGGLTKRICEEVVDDTEGQPVKVPHRCCACDEARYELIFKGLWSRNLHPKDFPTKGWTTRFSDIVGAAHSQDYRFWEYGRLASDGVREFGEHGSARLLEQEFSENFKNGKIRTIIKARGPAFPNLNGHSIASVRADPEHHLLSLAARIEPSPDWIVGISGIKLCMPNCTWLDSKVISLYPWDIGTDAGPSYTSADQPQMPPDVIRRMRSDNPNDPRSPFFDESGAPMKPLATLTLRKQRLYERPCTDEESNNNDIVRECFTHPWSPWTECSARCGEGQRTRTRIYKQPEIARIYNCDALTVRKQNRPCIGNQCAESEQSLTRVENQGLSRYINEDAQRMASSLIGASTNVECELSEWGPWSPCNQTCGRGRMMRTRYFLSTNAMDKCQETQSALLTEFRNCVGRNCAIETQQEERYSEPHKRFEVGGRDHNREAESINIENRPLNRFLPNQQEWPEKIADKEDLRFETPGYRSYGSINTYEDLDIYYKEGIEVDNLHPANIKNQYDSKKLSSEAKAGSNHDESASYRVQVPRQTNLNPHNREKQYLETYDEQNVDAGYHLRMPECCFQPLTLFTCRDEGVMANYWFYNYCTNECMIFAAGACDKNQNKFKSLEMCKMRCRHSDSVFPRHLPDCQVVGTGAVIWEEKDIESRELG